MPTTPARSLPRALVALAVVLAGPSLAACSSGPGPDRGDGASAEGVAVPADLAKAFARTLRQRARAIREGDRVAFLEGIDQTEKGFVTAQQGYFDNLDQLPLEQFGYRLDPASMVRQGDQYWVVVRVLTQLSGFDEAPVVSRDRFRFAPVEGSDRYVVSSVTDRAWEESNRTGAQPWDLVPVHVRTSPEVLGVFDDGSVGSSAALMESMSEGMDTVEAAVPYDWPGSVVFYALSDTRFLHTLEDLPGGDPETVDGVAFPVSGTAPDDTANIRVALHPDVLGKPGPERDRLVRHELVHVALGGRDDRVPVWLSEGIAEWVSVQPLAPEERRLPEAALNAALSGVRSMPADDTFNGDQSAAHYGLSWWACEYLVAGFGEESLWRLLEELAVEGAEADTVLESLFGLDTTALARRGARLMVATYRPAALPQRPAPTDEPSGGPSLEPAPPTDPTTPDRSPRTAGGISWAP